MMKQYKKSLLEKLRYIPDARRSTYRREKLLKMYDGIRRGL